MNQAQWQRSYGPHERQTSALQTYNGLRVAKAISSETVAEGAGFNLALDASQNVQRPRKPISPVENEVAPRNVVPQPGNIFDIERHSGEGGGQSEKLDQVFFLRQKGAVCAAGILQKLKEEYLASYLVYMAAVHSRQRHLLRGEVSVVMGLTLALGCMKLPADKHGDIYRCSPFGCDRERSSQVFAAYALGSKTRYGRNVVAFDWIWAGSLNGRIEH